MMIQHSTRNGKPIIPFSPGLTSRQRPPSCAKARPPGRPIISLKAVCAFGSTTTARITKGFVDKVIYPGVAYDYDTSGRWPRMIKRWHNLQGITLITTMNSAGWVYKLVFGNAIKKALFTGTFWKMGYRNRKWINFSMVKFVTEEKEGRPGWHGCTTASAGSVP